MNGFVETQFNSDTTSIICTFVNQQENLNTQKFCSIQYGPGESCHNLSKTSQRNSTDNKIVLRLSIQHPEELTYCFSVTAGNGTHTVGIKEVFNVGRWNMRCSL